MSFKDDIIIDKFQLEEEWQKQPYLFEKWSTRYAEAVDEKDRLKLKIEVVKADIENDIRNDPKKFGLGDKPTVNAIAAVVTTNEDVVTLTGAYLDAVKNSNILQGVKEAMNHRKSALENLVKLFLNSYYTKPDAPAEFVQKIEEEVAAESQEKIKKKLRKKMRSNDDD